MTPRRLSKRTLAVNKRKSLETKLQKKKNAADLRLLKSRSKLLQKLRDEELDLFTEEAHRLSDIADVFEFNLDIEADKSSQESLCWDNSAETPTFLTATSSEFSDDILEELLAPVVDSESLLQDQVSLAARQVQSRRKTSTDPDFLEDSGPVNKERNTAFNWPPRFPSAEPEVFSPFSFSTSRLDLHSEEVFDTEATVGDHEMEEGNYKTRLKAVNVAERKVKNEIKQYMAVNLTAFDLDSCGERLKEIRNKLDFYNDTVDNLVCDLDAFDATDQPRIAELEKQQELLSNLAVKNEKEVKGKVSELLAAKPMSQVEKETLDLKRRQLDIENDEKKKLRAEKSKRILIDMNDISTRSQCLLDLTFDIKKAAELSDQDVRLHLLDSKRWESKLEDISSSKVKVDKEIIGADVDNESIERLDNIVERLKTAVKEKIAELKKVDTERCLFSLSKAIKQVAVYPMPFHGKEGEDVYKFKEKLLEAITTNQIREKDKIEVLRKNLRGDAWKMIGEHYENIENAFEALLNHYGLAKKTWDHKLKEFVKTCKRPQDWVAHGTKARAAILCTTIEFIREAEKLAKDHKDLQSTIISHATNEKFFEVIPKELIEKIQELGDGPGTKEDKRFQNIKTILNKQHQLAIELYQFSDAMQLNTTSFNAVVHGVDGSWKKDKGFKNMKVDPDPVHDCSTSSSCCTDWGRLGCSKLYKLSTVVERREFLKKLKVCWSCGLSFDHHKPFDKNKKGWHDRCMQEHLTSAAPAQCSHATCTIGAAVCIKHAPKNAKPELLHWIKKNQIRTTVSAVISSTPFNASCRQFRSHLTPASSQFSKDDRIKLQNGETAANLSNEGLLDFFNKDKRLSGDGKGNILGIPKGDVAFVFCMIKGKKSGIQAFIDNGCNCCIMRDGIPENELRSCKLQNGPITIDVATGISVNATGEWGCALPMLDGSHQLVRGLTVPKVTSDMPYMQLRPALDKIKASHANKKDLQKIQIPEILGGQVDMILGIQFSSVYPEPIHHLDNGLTVFRSKFLPNKPGEIACIGGPVECIHNMASHAGATFTVRYLTNFLSRVSSGYTPKIDFFPSTIDEMEDKVHIFADKSIPQLAEFFDNENEGTDEEDRYVDEYGFSSEDEGISEDDTQTRACSSENLVLGTTFDMKSKVISVREVLCIECGDAVAVENRSMNIQAEMRKFFEQQEAGLDSTFRCLRCRDCKQCLKGAGEEMKSMLQERHQQIIRDSVRIDKKLGKAVAKLPFLTDPTGKLTNNSRSANKRLENVCRKYGSDPEVKEMINAGFKKLIDRGHIVYLEDLSAELQNKLKNAMVSYTIPWDVAFKEGSLSTPARPVFDASSKTSGGYSLNDLLPKGQPDMVRLIDLVLGWSMGPSAFIGDIRQFYNMVLLHKNFWQFQRILLKENLDPDAKTVVAFITTLIYGVKPVGTQCEEIIKLVAEEVKAEHPDVTALLTLKRYVDDFGTSTTDEAKTNDLIKKTDKVLGKIGMEVKAWVESGKDPPEAVTDDGVSVGFAGLTWFPKAGFFKLNIQSLHFGKKKRGKFQSDLVRFDQTKGLSFDEFTPKKITRTNCTSVTARIFDITGKLSPLTLKLKSDLRQLISFEPSWKDPIPDHQREIWVKNFQTIEEVRDILYLRCSIPTGAITTSARVMLLCDAADVGIILAAYVGYELPGGVWSCDLLFGKGLLAAENWTIPQKELHGLSALSNLKVILENCLSDWIISFHAFTDSEIALCWTIYEKTKLTTFVRNRVINIRTKMGVEILHHVDGKENPTDVGTRPELITSDSVRPGSVWLCGRDWMKLSMNKALESGVIKTAEDIRLTNDKKKTFKEGIAYDTFDESEHGIFAIAKLDETNHDKMFERQVFSKYLFPPLERSFKALVRITALVLLAAAKFKRFMIKKRIERGEQTKLALRAVDFPPAKFKVFSHQKGIEDVEPGADSSQFKIRNRDLQSYFSTQGVPVVIFAKKSSGKFSSQDHEKTVLRLSAENLSAALENLFRKATKEVFRFNALKDVQKIATESDGILFCNTRLLESAELKAVGHLADTINISDFTGVNFRVPVLDQHSPLALSIALHMHYVRYPHRGIETQHRMCLQFASIMKARKMFSSISKDCLYCKKIRGKYLEQVMGPLSETQLSISPVFYYTLVDLWGPLKSFVPGYEKITRSTVDKPHEIYMMVFACCATGTVNVQVIEGKDTGFCLDGMNRFFCETTVPKFMFTDEEGGLVKGLKYGRVDFVDLSGTLSRQKGISFDTVVPQGHSAHGRVEKRIHMLQESLEQSEIRGSRCTSLGWHTIGKLIERSVNSIPLGYLHHETGGMSPLLRILTPNCLKLITNSDRAPVGLFTVPDSAAGIMDNIQEKYEAWYHVWNEQYLPLVMSRRKWHFHRENMKPGDIIYFKLTESKMSANWRIGKVEEVKLGQDGYVRQVTVAYKDTSNDEPADWTHRTVERPVRNIVKLFNIEDTTLLEDIQAVFRLSAKKLEEEKLSFDNENKVEDAEPAEFPEDKSFDYEDVIRVDDEEIKENLLVKTKPKRRSEVERLKIDMKGWSFIARIESRAAPNATRYADTVSTRFKADLKSCKLFLSKIGFVFSACQAPALSTSQVTNPELQAVIDSTVPFLNHTMIPQYSEVHMQVKSTMACGHVREEPEYGGCGDSSGEVADSEYNKINVNADAFDDFMNIFLM